MALEESAPAKLARLLETVEPADRQEIVTWLLGTHWPQAQAHVPRWAVTASAASSEEVESLHVRRQITGWLPAGEANQLVTVRLPSDQHERLRTWCGEHNFTMAAVLRGLIDRFLATQAQDGDQPREASLPEA